MEDDTKVKQVFPETQWSLIQRVKEDCPQSMERWCHRYVLPMECYLLSMGCQQQEAEDITQDFICKILTKSPGEIFPATAPSFRAFIKTGLKHAFIDAIRKKKAAKRGGHYQHLDIDDFTLGDSLPTPDQQLDKAWLLQLIQIACQRLEEEMCAGGKQALFLKISPFLDGRKVPEELSEELGMTSVAFRAALYRMRKRLRDLIEAEIRQTCVTEEDFQEELRHLQSIFSF